MLKDDQDIATIMVAWEQETYAYPVLTRHTILKSIKNMEAGGSNDKSESK